MTKETKAKAPNETKAKAPNKTKAKEHIVQSSIKEGVEGKTFYYKQGDKYKGNNAQALLKAGVIK